MAGKLADACVLEELVQSIKSSPLASIVTDPRQSDNPIVAANAAFEALTGYQESELIGQNCRILAGEGTDRSRSQLLSIAVAEARPAVVELLNFRKDGSSFMNAVMIAPVFDDDAQLVYFVGSQMAVADSRGAAGAEARAKLARLTPKQTLVLSWMAKGLRNRQIGIELGLTEKTIKMHRSALVRRLGLTTAAEAIRLAIEATQ